jgi:Alpha/beta hydrolase of unknown function (DUF1400)
MIKRKILSNIFRVLLISLTISWARENAKAAEYVVLKYSILHESISVSELSDFAKTGEPSRSLRAYLRMANKEPDELRTALTKEVKVNPTVASKVLNSLPGEFLLDGLSDIIRTPSGKASRQSLRAALVKSALPDGDIKLIEVLENYPTSEVHIEGDRLVEVYNQINGVLGNLSQVKF